MIVTKLNQCTYRVVLGSNESDIFYVTKRYYGSWCVMQKGVVLDFATSRNDAINLAVSLKSVLLTSDER